MIRYDCTLEKMLNQLKKSKAVIIDETCSPNAMRITFAELAGLIESTAEELQKMGFERGERIVIATGNNIAFGVLVLSCTVIGVSPILVGDNCNGEYLKEVIALTAPSAVFLRKHKRFTEESSVLRYSCNLNICNEDINLFVLERDVFRSFIDPCVFLLSSGSTGHPKAVIHSFNNLLTNSQMHLNEIRLSSDERILQILPMHFSYGFVAGFLGALQIDCSYIINENPFSVSNFYKICEKYGITVFSATPYIIKQIVALKQHLPECIKKIAVGGDFLGRELIDELFKYYDSELFTTYGLTEAGPRVFTNRVKKHDPSSWNALGRVLPNVEVKLRPIKVNSKTEIGELLVKSPTNMLGYYTGQVYIDRSCFEGEWLRTGDNVVYDKSKGEMCFLNRSKHVIVVGGEKIFPGYIRNIICQNKLVNNAHIYFKEDDVGNYVPVAEVILNDIGIDHNYSSEVIKNWCKRKLRRIEIPREINIVDQLTCYSK